MPNDEKSLLSRRELLVSMGMAGTAMVAGGVAGGLLQSTAFASGNQGENQKARFIIDKSGMNQQEINDGIDSIQDLLNLTVNLGAVVYVKSFYKDVGLGGGFFELKTKSTEIIDNVVYFKSKTLNSTWVRVEQSNLNVYHAGVQFNNEDQSEKINNLLRYSKHIDLFGNLLKLNYLNLVDDMVIENGTLDFTNSTSPKINPPRSPIMSSKVDRGSNTDYEVDANYQTLQSLNNVTFNRIHFKSLGQCALLHKSNNIVFNFCSGNWSMQTLFKFVGGWHGTPLKNDTPTSYNLIDPKNGRCRGIYFNFCDWKANYDKTQLAHPAHFVACEDVFILGGSVDAIFGYRADIYNKNVVIDGLSYENTNKQSIIDAKNGQIQDDALGVYIGQNTYDVFIRNSTFKNFLIKCFYIEAASRIYINDIVSECDSVDSVAVFADIQGNYRNAENTFWGNCADIYLNNISSKGTYRGLRINTYANALAVKNLSIKNTDLKLTVILSALTLAGVENVMIDNFNSKGNLEIYSNVKGGYIKNSSFYNDANFALFLYHVSQEYELPAIENTNLTVGSGSVIYNNGKNGTLKLSGGSIGSNDNSAWIQSGADPSQVDIKGLKLQDGNHRQFQAVIQLADRQFTVYEFESSDFHSQYTGSVSLQNEAIFASEYGILLDMKVSFAANKVQIVCRNISGKPVSFTGVFRVDINAMIINNM
ncbi:hypothetical protein [Cohnella soli]|uniref:Uncharacterized protein n=1 Tax=Cohnella soli TaxID=425005 RepID=A0ABW0HZS0_9BACL